jgi:hypothetical protein
MTNKPTTETAEQRTKRLYAQYVSNGYMDTDGYFGPVSFEAFASLPAEVQERWAR